MKNWNSDKYRDLSERIYDIVFSRATAAILIVLFCAFFLGLAVVVEAENSEKRNKEMSINSGVIVEKHDIAGVSKYPDRYYFVYENENSDGEKIRRTDRVTAVTYVEYDIGDMYYAQS